LVHSDNDNAGSSDVSRIVYTSTCDTYHDNADSSGNDNDIAYDPGGISSNNTFGSSTQDTSSGNDGTSNDTLDGTMQDSGNDIICKSPFDTNTTDNHRHDAILGTTNDSLSPIKSNDSRIVYYPSSIGFSNDSALGSINASTTAMAAASHTILAVTPIARGMTATSHTTPVVTYTTTMASASTHMTQVATTSTAATATSSMIPAVTSLSIAKTIMAT